MMLQHSGTVGAIVLSDLLESSVAMAAVVGDALPSTLQNIVVRRLFVGIVVIVVVVVVGSLFLCQRSCCVRRQCPLDSKDIDEERQMGSERRA